MNHPKSATMPSLKYLKSSYLFWSHQCCIPVILKDPNTETAQCYEWNVSHWIPPPQPNARWARSLGFVFSCWCLNNPCSSIYLHSAKLTNHFQFFIWFFKKSKHVGGSHVRVSLEVGRGGGRFTPSQSQTANQSTWACGDGGGAQRGGRGVKRYAVKFKETRASSSPGGSPPKGWLYTLVTHHPSNPWARLSEHRLTHCVIAHILYHHTHSV